MTSIARPLWRRAKMQVADDVRSRLADDLSDTRARLEDLQRQCTALTESMATLLAEVGSIRQDASDLRSALATQLDAENESNELIGRLLARLGTRVDVLEAKVVDG